MNMENVREYRGMPFLEVGMKVFSTHRNQHGVVTGSNHSGNLDIRFDGDHFSLNCHPHFEIEFFNEDGAKIFKNGKPYGLSDWYLEYEGICRANNVEWLATGYQEDYEESYNDGCSPQDYFDDELDAAAADQ